MNIRTDVRSQWAELETQRRLNLAISERLEQRSRQYEDGYDAGRRERREVALKKDQAMRTGFLLIFPTVLGVALMTAVGPASLLVGAACGAGVLISLKRHGQLCAKEDAVEHRTEQLWYERSRARLDAHSYTREAENLTPKLEEAWTRLQEVEDVARLAEPHPGGSVQETPASVIVGGVRLPRARPETVDARGWLEWNDPRHPGQAPFREAGEVTYAYPGGVVTGSIEFESPFLSKFTIRTRDGQQIEGNSNLLGGEQGRLWISDRASLDRLKQEDELRAAVERWREEPILPVESPPQPYYGMLDSWAARQHWTAYDPAQHGPDHPPFVTGARVAYAADPDDVVEGSATFGSRWESTFTVRTDDGRLVTGNTNEVAAGQARLWLAP